MRSCKYARVAFVANREGCLPLDRRALERLLQLRHLRRIPVQLLQLRSLLNTVVVAERSLEHDRGDVVDVESGCGGDGGVFIERVSKGVR